MAINQTFADCLGIIPARYASQRFPGKMLAPVLGKSLLQRTYENARCVMPSEALVIATDDERIFTHAEQFGANVVMTKPTHLNGTERLAEVLDRYYSNEEFEIVINIQGDEPCLSPEAIISTVEALRSTPQAAMATAVVPIKSCEEALSPSVVKCVFDHHGHALYFSRALIPSNQKGGYREEDSYFRHLGLYAYRPSFLHTYASMSSTALQRSEDLEQLRALELGYKIKVAIVESLCTGVDTPEDILKIESFLCQQSTFS